jgi:hypothetical protein
MTHALAALKHVDEHFARISGLQVPEATRIVKNVPQYCEHYEIWREVRRAIREIEQGAVVEVEEQVRSEPQASERTP